MVGTRSELVTGLLVVLFVGAVGVLLTTQGWRSRVPAFDLMTYVNSVHNLLATGTLPPYGDPGSYGSFSPPGTTYLMVPSTLLFADPRLSEYAGGALLYVAALVGVFLVARTYFGIASAYLAIPLYGLSEIGLFYAGSLWPIGRPEFYVWFVYLVSRWALARQAVFLGAAIAVWGIGMYVDMAIAPILFILPAVWLASRPPLRLFPLVIAGVLVLVIWFPFLRFETTRGLADIKSELLLQNIFPANYRDTWCDPSLVLRESDAGLGATTSDLPSPQGASRASPGASGRVLAAAGRAKDTLLYNFNSAAVPAGSVVLLLTALVSVVASSVTGGSSTAAKPDSASPFPRDAITVLALSITAIGVGMLLLGALGVPGLSNIQRLPRALALCGIAILGWRVIVTLVERGLHHVGITVQSESCKEMRRLLVIALLVPWFILLVVAEAGKPERFWWLWPIQIVFIAGFFSLVLSRLRPSRRAMVLALVLVVFLVVANSFVLARAGAWARHGWEGRDADEVKVTEFIADQVRDEGKDRAAIGYQTFIYPFMATYNVVDPQYKVGADFDLLFRYQQGITNTDQCAEGVSPGDEYRIVQTRPKMQDDPPGSFFDVSRDDRFLLLGQYGLYQAFKRG